MKNQKQTKVLLIVFVSIFLLTFIIGGLFFGLNQFTLRIQLQGEDQVTIPYGETYQDPGCRITLEGSRFFREPRVLSSSAIISGQVPEKKVGVFPIHYEARLLWLRAEKERVITVVDEVPPEIILISDQEQETEGSYVEEGFEAHDNVDGDLTKQVLRKEYEGEVHYTVKDSSGNQTTVIRKVPTFDITPPEILLEGDNPAEIPYGTPWQEPGYSAVDQIEGDLTNQVLCEGQVDSWLPGEYILTYTAEDGSMNTAIKTRTVRVAAAPREEVVLPQKKTIYLTFDDGPGGYTDYLLDVLNKYGVKATFFVVGSGHGNQMRRIVNEGHSIAVHSVTHNYRQIYASREAYFADLLGMQKIIEDHTGVKTTLMRFPGGGSNMVSSFNPGIMSELTEAVQDAGFQYFDWNVDSNDAGGAKTSEEVFQNVTEGCRNKQVSIVLQHDIHPFSVMAVEKIIQWGQRHGYQFLPLTKNSYGAHHGVNN